MKKALKLIIAVLLVAVLGVLLVLMFKNSQGSQGQPVGNMAVAISEVMASNKGSVPDGTGGFADWVELANTTGQDVDISGYGLSDDLFEGVKYVFPQGTVLPAGGYLVVFCSSSADQADFAPFGIAATEEVVLFDSSGHTVDSLELRAVAAGHTLALSGGAFLEMLPSPGYPNTEEGVLQYEQSMAAVEDIGVYINEFMASNSITIADENGEYSDWVELFNSTNAEVDLSGFGISDSISQPMKAVLPEGTVIPPGGYLVIFCSGNASQAGGQLHVPFALRAYEEELALADRAGRVVDSVSYSRQESDVSMARMPDGLGEFAACSQPSPGYANTQEGYNAFVEANRQPLSAVYISEIMGNNVSTLLYQGEACDWVELVNSGAGAVNLAGWALSDNANNPAKWVFPDITLQSGEYLTIYASGLDLADPQKKNDLHLNFAISSEGETIYLFDANGKLADRLAASAFRADVSYGRNAANSLLYYAEPTPGAANGSGFKGIASSVRFATLPGIYGAPVQVELAAEPGETIRYTLDCTTPTPSSPAYTGPITLQKNTVVRAAAFKEGCLDGATVSGTYLFTTDGAQHSLPVATLVTDPNNLWDPETGIYAYGDEYDPTLEAYGKSLETATFYEAKLTGDEAAWERPATFAIFDGQGMQEFSQNVGVRIAGSFGRGRAQKGFNIIARDEYGANRMQHAFFENRGYSEYKALVLRAGGQDQNRSKIRDELATGLLEGTDVNVLYQAYKPYVLYLNGEYWGVYFLKEKRNRFFVAQHEGIENNDDMNIGLASTRVSYGDNQDWLDLMQYVKMHDLAIEGNYEYVAGKMDISSFVDYMICEIYVGNTDHANIQYYQLPGGKWKWIYYDFCWGFGSPSHNTLKFRLGSQPAGSDLLNALLKNEGFKDEFCRRFAEIMRTVYAPERVNALIDGLAAAVDAEIAREREKFCGKEFMGVVQRAENHGSYDSFLRQIEALHTFANERPEYMKGFIQEEFGLSDAYMDEVFG